MVEKVYWGVQNDFYTLTDFSPSVQQHVFAIAQNDTLCSRSFVALLLWMTRDVSGSDFSGGLDFFHCALDD